MALSIQAFSVSFFSRPVLAVVCAAVLLSSLATCTEAQETIDGFQEIIFGTPFAEIESQFDLTEEELNNEARLDQYYGASETVALAGEDFDIGFGFKDDLLVNVTVSRWLPESDVAAVTCEGQFDHVFGMVKSRYGDPDREADVREDAISRIESVRFTDETSAYILLSATSIGPKCLLNVSYSAPAAGDGF